MARVRVTQQNVKTKLTQWFNKQSIVDELVFNPQEIDSINLVIDCFDKGFIIEVQSDSGPFMKFVYKEHLT